MNDLQDRAPTGSLEMMVMMQAAQTAAQGFVKQSENAVPLEQERTRQLEIRARFERERLRWNYGILVGVLLCLAAAVGFSLWSGQWLVASHIATAGLAFLAGQKAHAPPRPQQSQ